MREGLIQAGWEQGAIFRASDIPDDIKEWSGGTKNKHICIVLPYSCAVVSDNLNEEPRVEVIRLSKAIRAHPEWRHNQHPRNLVIPLTRKSDGSVEYWRARMADRYFLPKVALPRITPAQEFKLTQEGMEQVIEWILKRYTKVAFPDAFNDLCKTGIQSLHELIISMATNVSKGKAIAELEGVYIQIQREDNGPYEISFLLLHRERSPPKDHLVVYAELRENINEIFSEIADLELDRIDIFSSFEISLGEIRTYQRLEYDDISYVVEVDED